MIKRVFLTALMISVLIGAAPASARRGGHKISHRVVKRLPLKFKTTQPTFSPVKYMETMDRGRLIYLGRGLWHDQSTFYFLDLKTLRKVVVRAPVPRFLRAHRQRFPRAGTGKRVPAYTVQRLLYYDMAHGVAGILLLDRATRLGGRFIYLHWDLRSRRITHATTLAVRRADHHWISVTPIRYSPARKELTCQVLTKLRSAVGGKPIEVQVLALGAGRMRVVTAFLNDRRFSRGPFADPARERAFLVEYAEGRRDTPKGFLVDLRTGKRRSFPIPLVTYGVAFSADGRTLYAYSAKTGYAWAIDTRTGKRRIRRRVGGLGHEAGMIFPGTLLVVRNKALHFLDAQRLRTWKTLPTSRFHQGFCHVQGSRVLPGRLLMRTSDVLYVIDFTHHR